MNGEVTLDLHLIHCFCCVTACDASPQLVFHLSSIGRYEMELHVK